jgi:serine protease Do
MRLHRTLLTAAVMGTALVLLLPAARAANPRRTPVVEAVERVRGAVVNIHSERNVRGSAPDELFSPTPSSNHINGMGTGIVIDPRGYIVTNHHVIDDVQAIRVRLHDGRTYGARVVYRDAENDLALLKIDAPKPLPTMPLGTADDLMVGETVIAIGNAYGYAHTVTSGIVSAVKRDVVLNKEVSYKGLIQTDASINPGNSGGPLLNMNGELIGVNVAIRAGAQGIGFAIPVDTMIRVMADLLNQRRRGGTWEGFACRDRLEPVEAGLVRHLTVERVEPSGPAAKAGLQSGDVIVQVADVQVTCSLDLERAFLDRAAGEHLAVVVQRKNGEQHLDLVLQALEPSQPSLVDLVWRRLGLRLSQASAELVARNNRQLHGGMTVTDLNPDGAAAKAGIQRGDVLIGLHQWETLTLDNVAFVLTHPDLASFTPLRFYIVRSGQVHRGWIQQVD